MHPIDMYIPIFLYIYCDINPEPAPTSATLLSGCRSKTFKIAFPQWLENGP